MTEQVLDAAGEIVALVNAGTWARDNPDDADVLLAAAMPRTCGHGQVYALAGYALVDAILDDLACTFAIDRAESIRRMTAFVRDGQMPAGGLLA